MIGKNASTQILLYKRVYLASLRLGNHQIVGNIMILTMDKLRVIRAQKIISKSKMSSVQKSKARKLLKSVLINMNHAKQKE